MLLLILVDSMIHNVIMSVCVTAEIEHRSFKRGRGSVH